MYEYTTYNFACPFNPSMYMYVFFSLSFLYDVADPMWFQRLATVLYMYMYIKGYLYC